MLITGKTSVYGIIGDPVEHSLSPVMQNSAFEKLGMDCVYVPFRVGTRALGIAVQGLRSQGVLGFNVTVPHKIGIVRHLDKLDPVAKKVGAVNTVKTAQNKLVGYNTDTTGVLEALKNNGIIPNNNTFTILGAGGAAKAITYALIDSASRIAVLNRTLEKVYELKRGLKRKSGKEIQIDRLTKRNLMREIHTTDVLINATSIGMKGNPGKIPIEGDLPKNLVVFDIVYDRCDTELIQRAKRSACRTIKGTEMLLYQAAAAFELWMGVEAPIDTMRHSLVSFGSSR